MLRISDLGNWNDKFIIFVESNDKSLRIGMYWEFSVCGNFCFYFYMLVWEFSMCRECYNFFFFFGFLLIFCLLILIYLCSSRILAQW